MRSKKNRFIYPAINNPLIQSMPRLFLATEPAPHPLPVGEGILDKDRVAIKRQVLLFCFARGKKPQAHYLRAEGKRLKLWREKDSIKIVLNRRQSMGTKGAAAEVFLTAFR